MSRSSLRATLRIARRDAARAKGRSLLIIAMVALPVLGVTGIDVLVHAAHLSPAQQTSRQLGQADLQAQAVSSTAIHQDSGGYGPGVVPTTGSLPTLTQIRRLLPAGAVLLPDERSGAAVRTRAGGEFLAVRGLDYANPVAAGIVVQQRGRAPRTSGEADASPDLLAATGLPVGGVLHTLHPDRSVRIVGTAVEPGNLHAQELFTQPGVFPTPGSAPNLLVGLPRPAAAAGLARVLNAHGVLVVLRQQLLHPVAPPGGNGASGKAAIGTASVVAGLAALEVILLAGAAFAVGARRGRRQLAVLAASGADSRQLRAVVLCGGLVLGTAGAVIGLVLGVALALAGRPLFERIAGSMFGPLGLHALDLVGIALLGLLTGVLAAALPARTAARLDVLAALAGRRGVTRTAKRVPALGLALVVVGTLLAGYGASRGNRLATSASYGPGTAQPSPTHAFDLILLGAALIEIGFVSCAPALVGAAGRLGRFLPLAPRLALRDASRHRGRTGPAVAAIMAALAGSVALSVYLASSQAQNQAAYIPQLRDGQAQLYDPGPNQQPGPNLIAAIAAALPTRDTVPLALLTGSAASGCPQQPTACRPDTLQTPPANRCPLTAPPPGRPDPRCLGQSFQPTVAVGGARLLHAITGRSDPAALQALAQGKAVVFDRYFLADQAISIGAGPQAMISGGSVSVAGSATPAFPPTPTGAPGPTEPPVSLPAVLTAAPASEYPAALISPATARRLHGGTLAQSVLFDTRHAPTARQRQAAQGVLFDHGTPVSLYVEQGYQGNLGLILLALIGGSAVITLGATAVATGLAAAEGRDDLAVLAAIGASPRVRRLLAMAQAGTVAFLGAVLGVLAGLVPAIAILQAHGNGTLAVPWQALLASLLGVPILAALAAGALTRSRLPVSRRFG